MIPRIQPNVLESQVSIVNIHIEITCWLLQHHPTIPQVVQRKMSGNNHVQWEKNKQHVKKHGFIIRAAPEKNRKGCRKVGNASNMK